MRHVIVILRLSNFELCLVTPCQKKKGKEQIVRINSTHPLVFPEIQGYRECCSEKRDTH